MDRPATPGAVRTPCTRMGSQRGDGTANRVGLGSDGHGNAVDKQGSGAGTDMVNNPNDPRRPQRRQQGRDRSAEAGRREAEPGASRDTPLRGRPANENEPVSAAVA